MQLLITKSSNFCLCFSFDYNLEIACLRFLPIGTSENFVFLNNFCKQKLFTKTGFFSVPLLRYLYGAFYGAYDVKFKASVSILKTYRYFESLQTFKRIFKYSISNYLPCYKKLINFDSFLTSC